MLNYTRRALEDFDNQHEFERLAADVLNALGYADVEPMAPGGGPDGGRDIKFKDGDSNAIAFVTLDKKIREKFKRDLAKQQPGEGQIAVFCNVDVSPATKIACAAEAIALGYNLDFYDIERLRSLLDGRFKDIRRRYLGIDDEIATRLRAEVKKLLHFPAAFPDDQSAAGRLECMFRDALPRRLFDLLMQYSESDVIEVPGIGKTLHKHMHAYYQFREAASSCDEAVASNRGLWKPPLAGAVQIHLQYSIMRFGGNSKEEISSGPYFLNFGITWESAEKIFEQLSEDAALCSLVTEVFRLHATISNDVKELAATFDVVPKSHEGG
jgi:hypothetical protein